MHHIIEGQAEAMTVVVTCTFTNLVTASYITVTSVELQAFWVQLLSLTGTYV